MKKFVLGLVFIVLLILPISFYSQEPQLRGELQFRKIDDLTPRISNQIVDHIKMLSLDRSWEEHSLILERKYGLAAHLALLATREATKDDQLKKRCTICMNRINTRYIESLLDKKD